MDEFVMANKCLEFCQALASHRQKFSFSLNVGSNFSFSLDTREKPTSLDTSKVDTLQRGMKKKLSPSQVRRNLKRKGDYLRKKSENYMCSPKTQPELYSQLRFRWTDERTEILVSNNAFFRAISVS